MSEKLFNRLPAGKVFDLILANLPAHLLQQCRDAAIKRGFQQLLFPAMKARVSSVVGILGAFRVLAAGS